jgi:hypothetical protein
MTRLLTPEAFEVLRVRGQVTKSARLGGDFGAENVRRVAMAEIASSQEAAPRNDGKVALH